MLCIWDMVVDERGRAGPVEGVWGWVVWWLLAGSVGLYGVRGYAFVGCVYSQEVLMMAIWEARSTQQALDVGMEAH
jgi:hypothetical protein